jgi:hypothetical protein
MENPTEIRGELEKLFVEAGIGESMSSEEKEELLGKLETSILFTAASELLDHLTEEGRRLFVSESFENCGKLMLFFRANSTPEVFGAALERAVNKVLTEFLETAKA